MRENFSLYDRTDPKSIEEYARKITGMTFGEIIDASAQTPELIKQRIFEL